MVLNTGPEVSSSFAHVKSITLAGHQIYHAFTVAIGMESRDKGFAIRKYKIGTSGDPVAKCTFTTSSDAIRGMSRLQIIGVMAGCQLVP